jgi:pimeloyl-ACP methyl ester carboxylesterase
VVRGGHDRIVSQAWAEEVARLLPHGRLVLLPPATHAAHFSHPDAVARLVREFIAGGRMTGP